MFAWLKRRHHHRAMINAYLVAADRKSPSRLDVEEHRVRSLGRIRDDDDLMADWSAVTLERLAELAPDLDAMSPGEVMRMLDAIADDIRSADGE